MVTGPRSACHSAKSLFYVNEHNCLGSPGKRMAAKLLGGVRSNFWQLSPKFTKFPKVAKSCQKLPKIIKFGNKILLKTVAIWLLIITSKAPLSVLEVIKSDKKSNIKLFAPV